MKQLPGKMRACVLTFLLAAFAACAIPVPAMAQAPAVLKAQQAQAESQKQSVAKRQAKEAREKKAAALQEAGLSPAELDDLIATLESQDGRERLISRLKALRSVSGGAAPAEEADTGPEPRGLGSRVVSLLSQRIDQISGELVAGAALVLDAPRLIDWIHNQLTDPGNREVWIRVLWKVLIVLAVGLAAEWIARLVLLRPRRAIEGQERDSMWVRVPFLLARTILDIMPIVAFGGAAYVVLPLLEPTEITRFVAIALINASVLSRAVMAAARMFFAPRAANLRILNLSDESANYLIVWVRRITYIAVFGYFFTETALLLGIPTGGYVAISKAIGLLLALLIMIFIMQNRETVAKAVRGPDDRYSAGVRMLRRRFADIWHVLAIIYVLALYIVWALEVEGGFEFVFRATALSFVIIVAAKVFMIASHHAMEQGFGIRPELVERFPGLALRANRYFVILHYVINGMVVVLAVFAILEAWGVDAFDWVGTPIGRRVTGSIVTIALIVVIAILMWEMISSVIERYLSRGENGEVQISARAKTLLPLLRKALLIVVSTIVGFIVLSEIGVNIGPLLAGAGVVGLAIGFGSQTLVKDVITGIFILAEDQFAVGDVIRVSDKAGLCEDITIRTIRLRDLGGNVHIIPFSAVTTVENMTKDYSRYVFDVGIAYREDVDEVIEVLRGIGEEMQGDEYYGDLINEPLEILGLDSFGDSAIVIKARITTQPIKQWEVGREFNRRMKRKFDELGIEIPFPHQTVYFGEEKGGGAPPAYVQIDDRRTPEGEESGKKPDGPARTDRVQNVDSDGD